MSPSKTNHTQGCIHTTLCPSHRGLIKFPFTYIRGIEKTRHGLYGVGVVNTCTTSAIPILAPAISKPLKLACLTKHSRFTYFPRLSCCLKGINKESTLTINKLYESVVKKEWSPNFAWKRHPSVPSTYCLEICCVSMGSEELVGKR